MLEDPEGIANYYLVRWASQLIARPELRPYMQDNMTTNPYGKSVVADNATAAIKIKGRVILIVAETTKNGLKILRLYITPASTPGSAQEQKKVGTCVVTLVSYFTI